MPNTKAEAYYQALNTFGLGLQYMTTAFKDLTEYLKAEIENKPDQVKPESPVTDELPWTEPEKVEAPKVTATATTAPEKVDRISVRKLMVSAKNKGLNPPQFLAEFAKSQGLSSSKFETIPDNMMGTLLNALKEGGYA